MTARPDRPPGDGLLPEANMVFDRRAVLDAPPERVWPWVVQLGKRRAGWYLPQRLERLLPEDRRASRIIQAHWQGLAIGDRIPDYGGREEWLEVVALEPPTSLVYMSERRGARFTWALLLTAGPGGQTELRLRFRGQLRSRGLRRRLIVAGGGFFDWATGALMVRGLRERLEGDHDVSER